MEDTIKATRIDRLERMVNRLNNKDIDKFLHDITIAQIPDCVDKVVCDGFVFIRVMNDRGVRTWRHAGEEQH